MSSDFTSAADKEESRIEKPVTVRAPDEYPHSHHRVMAMADLVSDPSYSPSAHLYTDPSGRPYWQHPLLTPMTSTSPQDYGRHNDSNPSVSAGVEESSVRGNENVYNEDVTEKDETHNGNDRDEYGSSPTNGGNKKGKTQKKGTEPDTEDKAEPQQPKLIHMCQYTNPESNIWETCTVNPDPQENHARKVVSHIFGRNKKPTQNIPDELWIWYCRKHYQRCKYTYSEQWPQKQVDLVRLALNNFEHWGEILYWNVVLRKREQDRQARFRRGASVKEDNSDDLFSFGTSSHRHTSRIARNWGDKVPRSHKARVTAAATAGRALSPDSMSSSRNVNTRLTPTGRRKASPKNVPCPVPEFVYPYLGEGRSFADVRDLIDRIESYVQGRDKTPEELAREIEEEELYGRAPEVRRFPDIEILPVFTPQYQRVIDKKDEEDKRGKKTHSIRATDVSISQSSSKTSRILRTPVNSNVYRDAGHDYHYQVSAVAPSGQQQQQQQQQQHSYLQLPPLAHVVTANPQLHLPPLMAQHSTTSYSTSYRDYTSYNNQQQYYGRLYE
ncbi:hypothetical pathogenicity factor [Talaromyces stipitatus ATCC 10500]|uniref:Hypothetical pathogenicity factor n=1 Tax=Talaromyces stipitatus (strain ATCC 10500 / CBS 375.48 / QM 6759 / NRRL 1006) TaxID=441959 RepID=B8M7G5_TALSN|nr:putative pathogenicity factor [Talaromyces stipitatus ATCC 10500]EED20385.1 hypothetical pathogenicity factor [Talaromyces stipitatus ATCC 10500]